VALILLCAALLTGSVLRLHQLDQQTLTHPEFWATPGVELPRYVKHPPERTTVHQVLSTTLHFDTSHPPGYYLVMLAWIKGVGTDLWAMRASSVLFSIATLVALFGLAKQVASTSAALLATWLLSVHGLHIFWSQQIRPWAFITLLGSLSIYLLVRLQERWQPALAGCYVLVTATGLWSEYFFWPLFLLQIVWVVLTNCERKRASPILGLQFVATALSTPVFIYMVNHMGQRRISGEIWHHVEQFLGFGGLLNVKQLEPISANLALWLPLLLSVLGAAALLAGIDYRRAPLRPASHSDQAGRLTITLLPSIAIAITVLVRAFFWMNPDERTASSFVVLAAWLALPAWLGTRAVWTYLATPRQRLSRLRSVQFAARNPLLLFSLGTFLILLIMHQRNAMLAQRGMLYLTPFLLILMSSGILRAKNFGKACIPLLLLPFLLSAYQWLNTDKSVRDYQGLAQQLIPLVKTGDEIWVGTKWWEVPMHYYLPPERFKVKPPPSGSRRRPLTQLPEHVWVIVFGDTEFLPKRMAKVIRWIPDYQEAQRVSARNAVAVLYEHAEPQSEPEIQPNSSDSTINPTTN
jgi:hypothetical protein